MNDEAGRQTRLAFAAPNLPQPLATPRLGETEEFGATLLRLAALAPEPYATRLWLLGHGWRDGEGEA